MKIKTNIDNAKKYKYHALVLIRKECSFNKVKLSLDSFLDFDRSFLSKIDEYKILEKDKLLNISKKEAMNVSGISEKNSSADCMLLRLRFHPGIMSLHHFFSDCKISKNIIENLIKSSNCGDKRSLEIITSNIIDS